MAKSSDTLTTRTPVPLRLHSRGAAHHDGAGEGVVLAAAAVARQRRLLLLLMQMLLLLMLLLVAIDAWKGVSQVSVGGLCANVHAAHTEQSTSVTLGYWDEKDVRNEVGSVALKD